MKLFFLTILLLTINFSNAQQNKQFMTRIGSTGIGVGYEQLLNTKFSLSSSLQLMSIKPSVTFKGADYLHRIRLDAEFIQLELAGKWYPKAKATSYGAMKNNKFFIKGGLLIRNKSSYQLTSDYQKKNGNNQFDNTNTNNGQLIFKLKTNAIQPFVSLGFELINTDHNWSASIEGGLSYHGTPPADPFETFYETGTIKIYEPNFTKWKRIPQLIKLIKVYPLLNITVGKRF